MLLRRMKSNLYFPWNNCAYFLRITEQVCGLGVSNQAGSRSSVSSVFLCNGRLIPPAVFAACLLQVSSYFCSCPGFLQAASGK